MKAWTRAALALATVLAGTSPAGRAKKAPAAAPATPPAPPR
jgi:hypothetical protein